MGDTIYKFKKQFEYNLSTLPALEEAIINNLMTKSELLWKMLKYNTYDAELEDDLTMKEKLDLIEFKRASDESEKPVKLIAYQSGQVITGEHTEIRIFPYDINFSEQSFLEQTMRIQVFTHYNLKLVKNGRRLTKIMQEIIKCLNNIDYSDVEGLIDSATFDNTDGRLVYF